MRRSRARRILFRSHFMVSLLPLLVLGASGGQAAASLVYDFGPMIVPGTLPSEHAVGGDFDGDGLDDVAVLRNGRIDVIFGPIGNANPSESSIEPSSSALNLARLPDSDGDGGDELVTLNVSTQDRDLGSSAQVWRCGPTREFESWVEVPMAPLAYERALAVGDFDADGRPDLATAVAGGIDLHVQSSPGVFTTLPRIALTTGVLTSIRVFVGDVDGDGRDDLVRHMHEGGNSLQHRLTVVRFTGAGTSHSLTSQVVGAAVESGLLEDFDGDGRDELALIENSSERVRILRNLDTVVEVAQILPAPGWSASVSAGDLDLDGRLDLLVTESATRALRYHRGGVGGIFETTGLIPSGGGPRSVVWMRIEPTEARVPVVTNATGTGVVVLLRTAPFVESIEMLDAPPTALRVESADLDGEGPRDFAILSGTGPSVALYRRGVGDPDWVRTDVPIATSPRDLRLFDLTGDGVIDIVTAHASVPHRIDVRAGDGDGGYLAPVSYPTPAFPFRILPTDFDHDGQSDLVVVTEAGPWARVFRGVGAGELASVGDIVLDHVPLDALVHDIDHDGRPDLIVASSSAVQIHSGVAAALPFGAPSDLSTAGGAVGLAIADVNADGRLDLAVATGNTRPAFLLPGQLDGSLGLPVELRSAPFSRSIQVADFDGDTVHDLLVYSVDDPGAQHPGTVQWIRGSATDEFRVDGSLITLTGPMDMALGDLTGDMRKDLIVVHRTDPRVLIAANPFQGVVGIPRLPVGTGLAARIVPTPSFGAFGVELAGLPDEPVQVAVFDVAGRRVSDERSVRLGADGRGRIGLDPDVRPGVYLVRVTQRGEATVARAVVLP